MSYRVIAFLLPSILIKWGLVDCSPLLSNVLTLSLLIIHLFSLLVLYFFDLVTVGFSKLIFFFEIFFVFDMQSPQKHWTLPPFLFRHCPSVDFTIQLLLFVISSFICVVWNLFWDASLLLSVLFLGFWNLNLFI